MLATHIAGAILVQSVQTALYVTVPIIGLRHFEITPRQSVVLTAAPVVLFALSIFWNAVFERSRLGAFWLIYWLVASLPMGVAGWSTNFMTLAACVVIASVGLAAYHPAAGELLKRLYPDRLRGTIYGVMQTVSMLSAAGLTYGCGAWLERDPHAFRIIFPLAAGLQGVGVLILWQLAHRTSVEAHRHRRAGATGGIVRAAFEPLLHLREILAADNRFARYEGAFMTYGVGWMICTALVPIIAKEKLDLNYQQIASSAYMTYQITLAICMLPAGMLLDRLGAARATAAAFFGMALYPVGLAFASDQRELTMATLYYGLTHAGVSAGWMLGPVSFAPTPAKVPQYVAIHATLVGVRGAIFQALGVWIYTLTHSLAIPLGIAAISLAWAGVQMMTLHSRITRRL